ncbi:MAG TPA: class I SAM-dependent methyltransferase [Isosphaeraceae bacterium]|jgi:malonyl-CoA O-methyltransferase|nr:class I SAM-dependent methyltransferase [Isosphaeraceae bacterium]
MEQPEELSVRDGYAAWAACYDEDGNPLVALEGPLVRAWIVPAAGRRALDLGCGTGRHTLALAEAGARVIALDQSPEMLARACQKLKGHKVAWVRHALPTPLPFRAGTFDLVVLGLVAEHVADLPALMAEVARVLSPSGRSILSALHPDRTAEGMRARFINPQTGLRQPIVTIHRTINEYLTAAAEVGLTCQAEQTLTVTTDLAVRLPRAQRYVGKPLGWVVRLGK